MQNNLQQRRDYLNSPKTVTFDEEAQQKLLQGAEVVYKAVTKTMGPEGRLVMFGGAGNVYPRTTKDGVSVASAITLEDQLENMGAEMLIQAARKQVQETGDGTTLTVLLTFQIIVQLFKYIQYGESVIELINDVSESIEEVTNQLKGMSINCDDSMLRMVATISANNDKVLGKLIAEAVKKTGVHGFITWKPSSNSEHRVEYSTGYEWDTGIEFIEFCNVERRLMHFCTETTKATPFILVTDEIIQFGEYLLPIVKKIREYDAVRTGLPVEELKIEDTTPLIIIAPDVIQHALPILIDNVLEGLHFMAFIKPPGGLGTQEREFGLRDIAALTGGRFISQKTGTDIRTMELHDLGKCRLISSTKKKTVIEGLGLIGPLETRINELKQGLQDEEYDGLYKEFAEISLAKLVGGMATIYAGGRTDTEQSEIMDRIDDSIHATRSALQEGCVPGGGVALLIAKRNLEAWFESHNQMPGSRIVSEIIETPARMIMENSNWQNGITVINDILLNRTDGYNLKEKSVDECNMFDLEILDPVKVIVHAILNAWSVAKQIIHTSVTITNEILK